MKKTFDASARPHVALITNHGYAGVDLPVGGAPDTGGQNVYVNANAEALERLGYRVTIFTRGGFPFFDGSRIRGEPEYMSDHIRYVFVPGGGDRFLSKEEIGIALDEELDWLDAFIRLEAAAKGCVPWEVYELLSTHYWDAAVLGVRLVERWQDDIACKAILGLLKGTVPQEILELVQKDRHRRALGAAPAYHLGSILLGCHGPKGSRLERRAQAAAEGWYRARKFTDGRAAKLAEAVSAQLHRLCADMAPALHEMVAARVLGLALLELSPEVEGRLTADLEGANRHVWTPHSIGSLKDDNFRDRSPETRRELRFCERRSHERMVCDRTRAFAATSLEIAEQLRTHYRVPIQRIFYFPPCVDSRKFRVYSKEETAATYRYLAETCGVSEEWLRKRKIVFETSRMDRTKRKDLLLTAFARMVEGRDDVCLLIGGGPENELFTKLKQQLGSEAALQGKAFLTGFVPEEHIGQLFSMAELYVSPSEMEGFGMSVAYAAASRTAVITTELTPFSVQYAHDAARIVRTGHVEGFAQAMCELLDDDAERGRRAGILAERARKLDWENQTTAFFDHLRQRGFEIAHGRSSG